MAARLANETFILPEQISGTLEVAAQGGFVPRLGPQPGSLVAVITLVSLGQGVALVPHVYVENALENGALAAPWPQARSLSKRFCLVKPLENGVNESALAVFEQWLLAQ
jgi:DNA-binding transcriptional LysR family regulator